MSNDVEEQHLKFKESMANLAAAVSVVTTN
ncbi:Uncharacterised protein [Anaerobiospirillum thomasii]|uniref:Uncharacterized protein n=1 Tax=Anaerobiospirillum thomasii TaxID=179995 RepID=A0A2X0WIA6_9GAMM|nr:Uncharacterised protein [Anaerobiospirillum thomasii]